MGIKFDKEPLIAEESNYTTKVVNDYIVSDVDAWSRNHSSNFKLKSCLFGATNKVKNSAEGKWMYSGYGIVCDDVGSWHFMIFGVDNSSSSHADNR